MAIFNNFIEYNILLYYGRFENDNTLLVIIYDNINIYYNIILKRLYINAGVLLEYLLFYLPDFNFIKTLFVILKS